MKISLGFKDVTIKIELSAFEVGQMIFLVCKLLFP